MQAEDNGADGAQSKTPEDEAAAAEATWLETLPSEMRPVAQRYGRTAFDFTMACGISGEALGELQRAIQRAAGEMAAAGGQLQAQALIVSAGKAIQVLSSFLEGFAQQCREANGLSETTVSEIRGEIERMHALAGSPEAGRSPSGIILPH